MNQKLLTHLSTAIRDATHRPFEARAATPVGGGSINAAYRLDGADGSRRFLKLNEAQLHPMFIAEAKGLNEIAATNTVRAPRPIAHGIADKQTYLVLEYLELNARGDAKLLGEQLAALHRCPAKQFGFAQDNFIGTTPQPNAWTDDWICFWREQRLGFQLELAAHNGYGGKVQELGQRLMGRLPEFFDAYHPAPSLLHGDLWGGNHAYTANGTPVIFDPAPYYGDRETDLAMTELFGGYANDFYAAYRAAWPLDAGYATRKNLYKLYHMLNHANLFGGSYIRQAEGMMQKLLVASH
ncbi:MAG: fructosamine kinase family protein [Nitrosomonadales bacterium]|nr:fructosamine kinase family protein [Nitrosomonadales bacterium]